MRPGQVEVPELAQGVNLTSSLTLSPHSYIFVVTSTVHILRACERCDYRSSSTKNGDIDIGKTCQMALQRYSQKCRG